MLLDQIYERKSVSSTAYLSAGKEKQKCCKPGDIKDAHKMKLMIAG